jgi:hypothetical protein
MCTSYTTIWRCGTEAEYYPGLYPEDFGSEIRLGATVYGDSGGEEGEYAIDAGEEGICPSSRRIKK